MYARSAISIGAELTHSSVADGASSLCLARMYVHACMHTRCDIPQRPKIVAPRGRVETSLARGMSCPAAASCLRIGITVVGEVQVRHEAGAPRPILGNASGQDSA